MREYNKVLVGKNNKEVVRLTRPNPRNVTDEGKGSCGEGSRNVPNGQSRKYRDGFTVRNLVVGCFDRGDFSKRLGDTTT